jgi:glyoxylase-like metal-dependent hydrolase (beta-lactamase superfamily II)
MTSSRESFSVGDIECTAISDGTFTYPIDWIFSNAPREQLEDNLRDRHLPLNEVVSPYTCLLLKSGKHKVLIDTGADGLAPTTGDLLKQLAAEGITPAEITTVVLTHAHPDHIGGVIDANRRPAFPNARYLISKVEWDFWNSDPDLHGTGLNDHVKELLINCARNNLPPLKRLHRTARRGKRSCAWSAWHPCTGPHAGTPRSDNFIVQSTIAAHG